MRTCSGEIVGLLLIMSSEPASAAEFFDLGSLLTGGSSEALGVSGDGNVVVGTSATPNGPTVEGFRWTRNEGMVGVGAFPRMFISMSSSARAASFEGSIVVGDASSDSGREAFRYSPGQGLERLTGLTGVSRANAVSADGKAVVGTILSTSRGFKWTEGAGMLLLQPNPDGNSIQVEAFGVSADGNVVVGAADGGGSIFTKPVKWDAAGVPTILGNLAGATDAGQALAVSGDGNVIVGWSQSPSGAQAFRWTAADGIVGLGDLPGSPFNSRAMGASFDGSTIVGSGDRLTGGGYVFGNAFVWDEDHGMRNLRELLVDEFDLANELEGWKLDRAAAISADGTVIVGTGRDETNLVRGWMVDLYSESSVIAGDYNSNGTVDAADYTVWRDTFGSNSDLAADGNQNGTIDAGDYDVWKNHFGNKLGGSGALQHAAVPEPSAAALLGCGALLLAALKTFVSQNSAARSSGLRKA